jgi:phosphinothricin acetyltransferase
VAEVDNEIVGYAYASSHRERKAYQWCCESSVYIKAGSQRLGLASQLYRALFENLKNKGLVHVYAGITLPNAKSVAFHEAFGFRPIGVYKDIGFKLGEWHSVGWWGFQLSPTVKSPNPPALF